MTARKRSATPAAPPQDLRRIAIAIEAAMRALDIHPVWINDSLDDHVKMLADKYESFAWRSVMTEKPALTPKQTVAQLSDIKDASDAVLAKLMAIDHSTIDTLHAYRLPNNIGSRFGGLVSADRTPTVAEIGRMLEYLSYACAKAKPISVKRHGPAPNLLTFDVAKAAASDFQSLTFRPPNLSQNRNEFPDFLASILVD